MQKNYSYRAGNYYILLTSSNPTRNPFYWFSFALYLYCKIWYDFKIVLYQTILIFRTKKQGLS